LERTCSFVIWGCNIAEGIESATLDLGSDGSGAKIFDLGQVGSIFCCSSRVGSAIFSLGLDFKKYPGQRRGGHLSTAGRKYTQVRSGKGPISRSWFLFELTAMITSDGSRSNFFDPGRIGSATSESEKFPPKISLDLV